MNPLSLLFPPSDFERNELYGGTRNAFSEIIYGVLDELNDAERFVDKAVNNQLTDQVRHAHLGSAFGSRFNTLQHENIVVTDPIETAEHVTSHPTTESKPQEQSTPKDELSQKREAVRLAIENDKTFNSVATQPDTQINELAVKRAMRYQMGDNDPYNYAMRREERKIA